MARRSISQSLRFSVFERDKYTCQYCGRKPPEGVLQVDHVHPVALGGDNRIDNLLTACRDCNGGKGARDPGLAMPSRPPTYGERRAIAKDEAVYWADMALCGAGPSIKSIMWQMAAKAEDDGVLLILPHDRPDECREKDRLLGGLVAVGAARVKGRGTYEWWLTIEPKRGLVYAPESSWGLGSVGPIAQAPSIAEVYG